MICRTTIPAVNRISASEPIFLAFRRRNAVAPASVSIPPAGVGAPSDFSVAGAEASHDRGDRAVPAARSGDAWLNDMIRSNSTEPGRLPGPVAVYKVNIYG